MAITAPALPPVGDCPISIPSSGRVIFEGDSNTAGSRVGGAVNAFPALIKQGSLAGIQIENRGQGAATIDSQPLLATADADLVVIMFGTNDGASRGLLGRRKRIGQRHFEDRMAAAIAIYRQQGSAVLVLAPPPVGSAAMHRRIEPYRHAARRAAVSTGSIFRDPAEAIQGRQDEAVLQFDGLHLTSAAQVRIAAWLRKCIRVENSSGGTDDRRTP